MSPYPAEHACRLKDPKKYDRFNRKNCAQKHDNKCIDVIYGIKEEDSARIFDLYAEIEKLEAKALQENRSLTKDESKEIDSMNEEIRAKSEIQALRYPKKVWDADDAKTHCKDRDGIFEAASEEDSKRLPSITDDPNAEYRTFPVEELRVIGDDDSSKIEGYAAVFNKLSELMWGFQEKIAPGAFKSALKISDARALFNHDPNIILGRMSAKTLELREDKKGLFMTVTPPDTNYVRDVVLTPIRRKDIKEQSFGFTVKKDSWEEDRKKKIVTRTILEVERIYDVSPVTFPAYPDTTVAVRSMEEWRKANTTAPASTDDPATQKNIPTVAEAQEMAMKLKEEMPNLDLKVRRLQILGKE